MPSNKISRDLSGVDYRDITVCRYPLFQTAHIL